MIQQRLRALLDQPLAESRAVAAIIGAGIVHYDSVMRLRSGMKR
jgi:hypothetical protein